MADIHVLEGNFRENGSGSFRIAYHIPVPASYQNGTIANYPEDYTRTSVVVDIEVSELDEIVAGTMYEHIEHISTNVNASIPATTAMIRARWHDVETLAAKLVREQYKYYGTTLSRS